MLRGDHEQCHRGQARLVEGSCVTATEQYLSGLQAVSELQQQVADLKVEKEQLLKAVTEQEHDAACLAEHVAQIVQLKHVLATMQQENADKASKVQQFPLEATAWETKNTVLTSSSYH